MDSVSGGGGNPSRTGFGGSAGTVGEVGSGKSGTEAGSEAVAGVGGGQAERSRAVGDRRAAGGRAGVNEGGGGEPVSGDADGDGAVPDVLQHQRIEHGGRSDDVGSSSWPGRGGRDGAAVRDRATVQRSGDVMGR